MAMASQSLSEASQSHINRLLVKTKQRQSKRLTGLLSKCSNAGCLQGWKAGQLSGVREEKAAGVALSPLFLTPLPPLCHTHFRQAPVFSYLILYQLHLQLRGRCTPETSECP